MDNTTMTGTSLAIISLCLTCLGMVIAGLVWIIRLEGQIRVLQQVIPEVRSDLAYMRNRVDHFIDSYSGDRA